MRVKIMLLIFATFCTFTLIFMFNAVRSNQKTQSSIYTLKEIDGSIALFHGDKKLKTYSQIVLDVLPEYDQNLLKKGIKITSTDQLNSIIEDYE